MSYEENLINQIISGDDDEDLELFDGLESEEEI